MDLKLAEKILKGCNFLIDPKGLEQIQGGVKYGYLKVLRGSPNLTQKGVVKEGYSDGSLASIGRNSLAYN